MVVIASFSLDPATIISTFNLYDLLRAITICHPYDHAMDMCSSGEHVLLSSNSTSM